MKNKNLWISIAIVLVVVGGIVFLNSQYRTKYFTFTNYAEQVPTTPTTDWKTYTNTQYNFSFSYPSDFALTSQRIALSYIFKCHDDDQACLYYIGEKTSNGFEMAALEVQVGTSSYATGIPAPITIADCTKEGGDSGQPTQKSINGVTFYITQDREAGLGHRLITDLYRTYYNNTCYTIGISMANNNGDAEKELDPTQSVATKKELESILSTFKLTK